MACNDEQLAAYLDGNLGPEEVKVVEAHLATCEQCRIISTNHVMEFAEDTCDFEIEPGKVCGKHVGYGARLFHLRRCDDHPEFGDDDDV